MKNAKKLLLIIPALILVAGIITGVWLLSRGNSEKDDKPLSAAGEKTASVSEAQEPSKTAETYKSAESDSVSLPENTDSSTAKKISAKKEKKKASPPAFKAEPGAVQKSVLVLNSLNLTFEKPETAKYKCAVSNNAENYISVDAYNEGEYYWLMVKAKKPTENTRPVITVYKDESGKKTEIKKYQIKVEPYYTVKMDNISIAKGAGKEFMIINPYQLDEYELKYDSGIIKISQVLYDSDRCYYKLKGLKNGKTTVKAYLRGAKRLIGSFTVTVGDYKAEIKEKYRNVTLYYNSHIESEYLTGGSIDIGEIINNYNPKAVYSVKADKAGLIGCKDNSASDTTAKAVIMHTKKTGAAKISVYEKIGSAAAKRIGTFNLTVKRAQDSEVYASNRERDNDGIFYEFVINPGDTVDLKKIVTDRYLNTACSHFESGEFTFSVTSKNPETVAVDKNGKCTCLAAGNNAVTYTVVFKDGSKASGGGSFNIEEPEN